MKTAFHSVKESENKSPVLKVFFGSTARVNGSILGLEPFSIQMLWNYLDEGNDLKRTKQFGFF